MLKDDSSSVQAHLSIIQNVINRMASSSSSSKAWCITLVSAILVIIADKNKPDFAFITIIPTILFFVLDAYYLALEQGFRNSYNNFIKKLHNDELNSEDLYAVKPSGNLFFLFLKSLKSFSVYPFYLTLLIMILLIKYYVLNVIIKTGTII